MEENERETFFISDSLKDILDKDDLVHESSEIQAKEGNQTEIFGKFVKLSLADQTFTIATDQKMAKMLLQQSEANFMFKFMDETWILSASEIQIEKQGMDFHITLFITDRR